MHFLNIFESCIIKPLSHMQSFPAMFWNPSCLGSCVNGRMTWLPLRPPASTSVLIEHEGDIMSDVSSAVEPTTPLCWGTIYLNRQCFSSDPIITSIRLVSSASSYWVVAILPPAGLSHLFQQWCAVCEREQDRNVPEWSWMWERRKSLAASPSLTNQHSLLAEC